MVSRYLSIAEVDRHPISIKTQEVSFNGSSSGSAKSQFIGISLPWFGQYSMIDPDFSIFVSSKATGNCDSSKPVEWKIITGVVVGGSVFIALAITTIAVAKRNHWMAKAKANIKSFKLKKVSNN
ncbi:hypothetical protein DFA_07923 [Cavenderia fasciculata]|uniref:Uncharacterized protein n=1 Tax=Cavenderia fasciculata TaxID=261658 RepID=F4Q428_CACFS|nr:uncharacterized protein DFA_07923 [Cavenderia fasciculata]EGG16942.1 hypothetical protein DFA_07923 [Cavenderia fasciculata]|eukprot:XP_004355416.1 hypothetical protein DFA_07923 [Cavenderia fasciculata]